jgi:signal transduction histidine kinase
VTHEVGSLLDADFSGLARLEEGAVVPLSVWAAAGEHPPVPDRWPMQPGDPVSAIAEARGAIRWDDWSEVSGPIAEFIRDELGVRSTVGTLIVVEGRLWGALAVHSRQPLPQDSESRMEQFSELVATAIGNAEARAEVARLANEQAALRRVATLVAQGARPAEVFAAVSEDVGRLFRSDIAAVFRFDTNRPALVVVGVSRGLQPTIPVGTRLGIDEPIAAAKVYRTGRSARFGPRDRASLSPVLADAVRRAGAGSTVASPIIVEGSRWGAVTVASTVEQLPVDAGERLERFCELVATAIANTDSRAELAASRKRIVAASDEARRQIERDLHDGTQQRLVSLGLATLAAEANVPSGQSGLRSELSQIASGLSSAVAELKEISRGIHPAILTQGGLATALRTLARRSAIPVELEVTAGARLPEPIEVAAYFVASEALANAAKHARASRINISLKLRDTHLLLDIRDDGVGGADPAGGSGLLGLSDRVEALGGSIRILSPAGNGTSISVELPNEPDAVGDSAEST